MGIRPLDVEELGKTYRSATPFPHFSIEQLLEDAFAQEVAASYPSFEEADQVGLQFDAVNEHRKIQITDSAHFPEAVQRLDQALGSEAFREQLAEITGIPDLHYDASLAGGGMHMTGARGRLDVHVDFNRLDGQELFRRLNLLVYLNPRWERSWGGAVELWDDSVEKLHHSFAPNLNRAVVFETSDHSFHGVEKVTCPEGITRNSFAVYYYTASPPAGYAGDDHSTVFRARPDEKLKKYVLMPAERAKSALLEGRAKARRAKERLSKLVGKDD